VEADFVVEMFGNFPLAVGGELFSTSCFMRGGKGMGMLSFRRRKN